MSFRKEITQGLEQIQQMQDLYRQVQDAGILPVSFFSTTYDILKNLTAALHEMESDQLETMQEHLSKHESIIVEIGLLSKKTKKNIDTEEFVELESPVEEEVPPIQEEAFVEKEAAIEKKEPEASPQTEFLGDVISKRLVSDLRKAFSLNDRFRFQRDLFSGETAIMNDTLDRLNEFTSLEEAIQFLHDHFQWNWDEGPAAEFKGMLEKRFS